MWADAGGSAAALPPPQRLVVVPSVDAAAEWLRACAVARSGHWPTEGSSGGDQFAARIVPNALGDERCADVDVLATGSLYLVGDLLCEFGWSEDLPAASGATKQ